MTINQIRYFLKAYETGNMATAAAELFITRSALSKAIRELETECGGPLFRHIGGSLEPTETGEILRAKGLEMIELADSTMRLVKSSVSDCENRVRVGITPATGITIFPYICRDFRKLHPEIVIEPIEGGNIKVQNMLESGQMDVCLTTYSESFPDTKGKLKMNSKLDSVKLYDTEIVFCAVAGHPLADRKTVTIEDIAEERFVFLKKPLQRESEIHNRFAQLGMDINVVARAGQVSTARSIVVSETACSLQIRGMIDDGKKVVGVSLDPPAVYSNFMVWNCKAAREGSVKAFVEFCKAYDYSNLYANIARKCK